MNQNYNYYQQSHISRSYKSLIDVLIQIEKYEIIINIKKKKKKKDIYIYILHSTN